MMPSQDNSHRASALGPDRTLCVDEYRVTEDSMLGQGGYGEVFRAESEEMGMGGHIAVKFVHVAQIKQRSPWQVERGGGRCNQQ